MTRSVTIEFHKDHLKKTCISSQFPVENNPRLQYMSFQHFRLGEISLHQPLPHLPHPQGAPESSTSTFSANLNPATSFPTSPKPVGHAKQPYGAGDSEDGYTLVFPNLAAFNEWRAQEEERHVVEFVKACPFWLHLRFFCDLPAAFCT